MKSLLNQDNHDGYDINMTDDYKGNDGDDQKHVTYNVEDDACGDDYNEKIPHTGDTDSLDRCGSQSFKIFSIFSLYPKII